MELVPLFEGYDDIQNVLVAGPIPNDDSRKQSSPRSQSSSLSPPPTTSPEPPERWQPGRGKSEKVMKEHYKPLKTKHLNRLKTAVGQKREPYTLSDFGSDDEETDSEESDEPPKKRPRRSADDDPPSGFDKVKG